MQDKRRCFVTEFFLSIIMNKKSGITRLGRVDTLTEYLLRFRWVTGLEVVL